MRRSQDALIVILVTALNWNGSPISAQFGQRFWSSNKKQIPSDSVPVGIPNAGIVTPDAVGDAPLWTGPGNLAQDTKKGKAGKEIQPVSYAAVQNAQQPASADYPQTYQAAPAYQNTQGNQYYPGYQRPNPLPQGYQVRQMPAQAQYRPAPQSYRGVSPVQGTLPQLQLSPQQRSYNSTRQAFVDDPQEAPKSLPVPMLGDQPDAPAPPNANEEEKKADEKPAVKAEEKKDDEKKDEKKEDEKKVEKKEPEKPPVSLEEALFPDADPLFTGKMGPKWDISDDVYYDDLKSKIKPVDFGGWVQTGYTNHSDGVLNTRPKRPNLHQVWLYAEKVAEQKDDAIDWGFRADVLWGLDGENTQAYGNNPGRWDFRSSAFDHGSFHWAIPQLYGTLALGQGNIKIGHFFTLAGYEVVPSPQNFFYSHSFTWNFTEPFTHTGAMGTLKIDDTNELYAGYVLGWDSGFDQFHSASAFQGGFKWTPDKDFNVVYIGTAGNLGWIGQGYSHSIVATTQLTDKLQYILSDDVVITNKGFLFGDKTRTVSANNYLLYNYSETVGAGIRAEWWRPNGVNYYQTTAGFNLKPRGNLIVRPEVRYQWTPAGAANPLALPGHQFVFGIDAIFTF